MRRGYNCLTFDRPGQGRPVREQQLYFRHDWENIVTPAMVTQGVWSFGVPTVGFLTGELTGFTLDGVVDKITTPSLVLRADGETIGGAGQADEVFASLAEPKQLYGFGADDGAQRHCQAGAHAFAHQRIFYWLDETLEH